MVMSLRLMMCVMVWCLMVCSLVVLAMWCMMMLFQSVRNVNIGQSQQTRLDPQSVLILWSQQIA